MAVTGGILSLYALGRQWGDRVFRGHHGYLRLEWGVGYFVAGGIDVVLNPRGGVAETYLGDLLFKRSYNFLQQPRARLPARSGVCVAACGIAPADRRLRRKSLSLLGAAGVVVGLTGSVGAETFFVAMGAAVLAALVVAEVGRIKAAVTLVLPALFVYSFWFVPIAANYLRLGGFVNITRVDPVTLSPTAVLGSWGIVTPFALWGALACVRWKEVSARCSRCNLHLHRGRFACREVLSKCAPFHRCDRGARRLFVVLAQIGDSRGRCITARTADDKESRLYKAMKGEGDAG